MIPLLGRTFVHGEMDCYNLIIDGYQALFGITLNDYGREWEWWENGEKLYEDNYQKEGFVDIQPEEAKVGDLVLFAMDFGVINHAAIIMGPDLILHHMKDRPSAVVPFNRMWKRFAVRYARHKSMF